MFKKVLILTFFAVSNYVLLAENINAAEKENEKDYQFIYFGAHVSTKLNYGLIYGLGWQNHLYSEWLDFMPCLSISWETEPKFKDHEIIGGLEAGFLFKPFKSAHILLNYEFNYRIMGDYPVPYSNFLKPGIIYYFDKDTVSNKYEDRIGVMVYGHLPYLNFKSGGIKEPYGLYIVFTNTRSFRHVKDIKVEVR
ncbi:MAG: hypothetical protein OEZ13_08875 [Spirochaetia bacterium]|nr:hypothetical protein [Spirochaetia bacterium]